MLGQCPDKQVGETQYSPNARRGMCDGDATIGQFQGGDVADVIRGKPFRLANLPDIELFGFEPSQDLVEALEGLALFQLPAYPVPQQPVANDHAVLFFQSVP